MRMVSRRIEVPHTSLFACLPEFLFLFYFGRQGLAEKASSDYQKITLLNLNSQEKIRSLLSNQGTWVTQENGSTRGKRILDGGAGGARRRAAASPGKESVTYVCCQRKIRSLQTFDLTLQFFHGFLQALQFTFQFEQFIFLGPDEPGIGSDGLVNLVDAPFDFLIKLTP
jgi:hypothetical protein